MFAWLRAIPVWLGRAVTLIVFIAIWEALSRKGMVNPLFFGQPSKIALFLFNGLFVQRQLIDHTIWTMLSTLAAFVLGSAGGILVGLLFVTFPRVEEFLDPIFAGLNALPRIALAPLFLLWFGLGIASKIALGFSLTFFIVLASTVAGARAINPDHLMLAKTLGARPSQVFRRITLPGAVPTVFAGLRLGLIYALLGVIGGEIIAAEKGLGQLLSFLAGTFQINGVFAVLLLLAILGTSLTWMMTAIELRLLRWR
jgi:NitT/TauT family transport system permease protein